MAACQVVINCKWIEILFELVYNSFRQMVLEIMWIEQMVWLNSFILLDILFTVPEFDLVMYK